MGLSQWPITCVPRKVKVYTVPVVVKSVLENFMSLRVEG